MQNLQSQEIKMGEGRTKGRILLTGPRGSIGPVFLRNCPKRLRERGYNQARLLAKELGRLASIPVVDDCLIRRRHAPPQARTSNVDERHSNIAGAFACRDQRLHDRQVLLIDDVSTSGATLDACAAAAKAAGATSVWGLVIAREI